MRLSSVAVLFFLMATLAAPVAGQEWTGRARVDGRVTGEGGAPLAGATVSLRHLVRPGGAQVLCDARGHFVADRLASGSWTVEIAAPGYAPRKMGIHLPSESSWLDLFEVQLEKMRLEPPVAAAQPVSGVASSPPAITVPNPDTPASWEDVRTALAEGRVHHAHRLVSSLDPSTPGEAHVFFEIGRDLLTAGETEDAVTFFDRALDRDPDHTDAHYRRALALLALGRPEEARRDFEAVVALRPESGVAEKAGRALEELAPASAGPAPSGSASPLGPGTAE